MPRTRIYIMVFLLAALLFGFSTSALAEDLSGKYIGAIGIAGNYPYVEHRVRRYLTIRPSDAYDEKVIDEQCERIRNFYSREGWIGTEVYFIPEYIGEHDSVTVHIKIKKGKLLRYRNIDVVGNYSLPKSLVASKINTWKQYTPRRLRESISRIVQTYRMKGYPLARVRLEDRKIDLKEHKVDVVIRIDEGPYVTVSFSGNKHLGGLVLKKTITLYNEGAIDSFELEESVRAIQKRYKIRGFPYADAHFNRKEISSKRIHIHFSIDEGRPERVEKVVFDGNTNIGPSTLKDKIVTQSLSLTNQGIYDPNVLDVDLKRLNYYYKSKGYLDAKALDPDIGPLDSPSLLLIDIPVVEGEQTIVKSITFQGNIEFTSTKLKKILKSKVDNPLNGNILEEEKDSLQMYYGDNGYPYAKIELDVQRDSIDNSAFLIFTIDSGPKVYFGPITMIGDFITSQKAIRKALYFKEGDPFSFEKMISSKASLRRLGAFASASVIAKGIEEKATTVPITIKVEELRPFVLDFDLGYSTDQGAIGSIDFTNRNAFGWAKRMLFRLTGGRKFSKAEIGWIDPKLPKLDMEMTSNGWIQYDDQEVYKYIQLGTGAGLFRRFHRTSFYARLEVNRNYFVKGSSTAADDASLRNNTILTTSLSMSFDTRDNFADPTKGVYVLGYSNFYNEIKGKNAHFVKLGLLNGLYYPFGKYLSIANNARFDDIETFRKNMSIPSNELLLLGGDTTLRGFPENSLGPVNAQGRPTGGRIRFMNTTELRAKLPANLRLVFFHDMGFLTNRFSDVSTRSLRQSIGPGLYYVTPIGPIKFSYGFVVDRSPGEPRGRFHLSFGTAF